ncbi:hypothetical protein J4Q44_G00377560 [Coregonus suidteri]|uniref:Uncharacterized protein n=1 Tax=Coregonus suidteri TaxID=861788 RepID=A0AAN8KSS2_9TELE
MPEGGPRSVLIWFDNFHHIRWSFSDLKPLVTNAVRNNSAICRQLGYPLSCHSTKTIRKLHRTLPVNKKDDRKDCLPERHISDDGVILQGGLRDLT